MKYLIKRKLVINLKLIYAWLDVLLKASITFGAQIKKVIRDLMLDMITNIYHTN